MDQLTRAQNPVHVIQLQRYHVASSTTGTENSKMSICRFLVVNGVVSQSSDVPPISSLLESHPGAYTTSRTHNNASYLLFWERHLERLANSARILAKSRPNFLFGQEGKEVSCTSLLATYSSWKSVIQPRVNDSLKALLPIALKERNSGEELAITALVSGNSSYLGVNGDGEQERVFRAIDVYLHIGVYVPPVFGAKENGARLAVVGGGRDIARAKFAEWVRQRKRFEKLKPPLVNEVLLSNDGDQILEGSVTNFFVVCRKEDCSSGTDSRFTYEVQTASINDGVLPGVVRQLVIEVCSTSGIPIREVAPSWSQREFWEDAFITNSLRLVQHVETIQVPSSLELKTWSDVSWEKKCFLEGPGVITAKIQKEIMERAAGEGCPVSDFI